MDNKLYGLVGYPLKHSFSQKYFRQKFLDESIEGVDFLNFELEDIGFLRQLISNYPQLRGFSVTIPHKESIIPFLDEIDKIAHKIGAVNAVTCHKKNNSFHLKGYNTDYYGFKETLQPFLQGNEKFAIVLGNGGASKAVQYALTKLNIDSIIVSRSKPDNKKIIKYDELNKSIIQSAQIIVNTTPIGMWPNLNNYPEIPYQFIQKNTIVYDLIYNPDKTQFLIKSEKFGAKIVNGLTMLQVQADKAWDLYNDIVE